MPQTTSLATLLGCETVQYAALHTPVSLSRHTLSPGAVNTVQGICSYQADEAVLHAIIALLSSKTLFMAVRQMKRLYSGLSQEEVLGPELYETPEQVQVRQRRVCYCSPEHV